MAITIGANSLEGNSDWELRVNTSTKVEQFRNQYLEGNQNHPAFVAHAQGGWTYFTTATYQQMTGAKFPEGWGNGQERGAGSYGWDSTNGRYYAPITGWYYFHVDMYMYCDDSGTNNYVHLLLNKNGGRNWNNGRTPYQIHAHGSPRGIAYHPHGPNASAVMKLTEGQYASIEVYHNTSGQTRYHGNHTFFCGHLLD